MRFRRVAKLHPALTRVKSNLRGDKRNSPCAFEMKKLYIPIMAFLILSASVVLTFAIANVSTETAQFHAVNLTAENVNCVKCHDISPHKIHAKKSAEGLVSCKKCHGDILNLTIPTCTKCHKGLIHEVHLKKVQKVDCEYCHAYIKKDHNQNLLGSVVCAHCHRDLIVAHNNSCSKCHKTAPEIVKPVKPENADIICQNCHSANNLVGIHGNPLNKTICYNCHQPEKGKDIPPHEIHLPDNKATCEMCHLIGPNKVIIPECSDCHHNLIGFHLITKVPQKGDALKCSVCHQNKK